MAASTALTRLNPASLPDAGAVGYSQISIVEPGRLAFISGQVAWPREGGPTPATLSEQTRLVVQHAKAALQATSASPHDIAMVRVYMTDLRPETQAEVMPHLLELFDGAQPSLTGIGVAALAAPDLQIELEMVVRLPA
jgi:enamine deaminase RidA (YjgF/YER057c/UK114 family)